MYTRSYFTEDKKIDIPENYDGNAFRENNTESPLEENVEQTFSAVDEDESVTVGSRTERKGPFSSFFDKLPFKNLSESFPFPFFKNDSSSRGKLNFGTEEILICIIALYMFFSKDGDKECAIMLAILIFIT